MLFETDFQRFTIANMPDGLSLEAYLAMRTTIICVSGMGHIHLFCNAERESERIGIEPLTILKAFRDLEAKGFGHYVMGDIDGLEYYYPTKYPAVFFVPANFSDPLHQIKREYDLENYIFNYNAGENK